MGYHELHKPTHRIGTNGMPQPSLGMKSKDSKLNSIHTTHKKVSPKMSIYKTMDQLKAFFDKAS
jgi:hypothetical protein